MTWQDIEGIVNSPGAVAILALAVLWAGAKGVWVYGKVHQAIVDAEKERTKEWKEIATGSLVVSEKAVTLAERREAGKIQ